MLNRSELFAALFHSGEDFFEQLDTPSAVFEIPKLGEVVVHNQTPNCPVEVTQSDTVVYAAGELFHFLWGARMTCLLGLLFEVTESAIQVHLTDLSYLLFVRYELRLDFEVRIIVESVVNRTLIKEIG